MMLSSSVVLVSFSFFLFPTTFCAPNIKLVEQSSSRNPFGRGTVQRPYVTEITPDVSLVERSILSNWYPLEICISISWKKWHLLYFWGMLFFICYNFFFKSISSASTSGVIWAIVSFSFLVFFFFFYGAKRRRVGLMGENHVLKKAGSDFFLRLRLAVTGETGGVQASARKDPGPLASSLRFIISDNILVIVIKNII